MMSQAGGMDVNSLMQRLRRLATLDTSVFDEVRTDTNATVPAIVVVVVSTLLFALGGWLWWVLADIPEFADRPSTGEVFITSVILGSIISLVLWAVWVGVSYVALTQLFRARADINELVRVMGFAAAPLGLGFIMFIPALDFGLGLAALALFFGLTVLAVQSATDAAGGRVLLSSGAGFLVWAVVLALFVGDENILAPGFFVFDYGAELLRY
jgi:hypothetical protein